MMHTNFARQSEVFEERAKQQISKNIQLLLLKQQFVIFSEIYIYESNFFKVPCFS